MITRIAPQLASTDGDEKLDVTGIATLETAARLLLGRLPDGEEDYAALGRRVGMAGRGMKYSGSYMKYVMLGKHKYTDMLHEGTTNLIHELIAKPPDQDFQWVRVRVANGFHVPEGTLIQRDARTCICGVSFVPTAWNQINHTKACAKMRERMKKRSP